MTEPDHDYELWTTSADEYEMTDDDVRYAIRSLREDSDLCE